MNPTNSADSPLHGTRSRVIGERRSRRRNFGAGFAGVECGDISAAKHIANLDEAFSGAEEFYSIGEFDRIHQLMDKLATAHCYTSNPTAAITAVQIQHAVFLDEGADESADDLLGSLIDFLSPDWNGAQVRELFFAKEFTGETNFSTSSELRSCLEDELGAASLEATFNGIANGNAAEIARHLDSNVEISILDDNADYSRAQAEAALSEFFQEYKPQSFALLHEGVSPSGAQFGIGNLQTSNGTFRTTVYATEKNGLLIVQSLSFEEE